MVGIAALADATFAAATLATRPPRRCHRVDRYHAPCHRVRRLFQSPIRLLCVALCILIRDSLLSSLCSCHVQASLGAIGDASHSTTATVINSSTAIGTNNQYRDGSCSCGASPKANNHGSSQVHPEGWITTRIIDRVSRALHDHSRRPCHHRHWVHRDLATATLATALAAAAITSSNTSSVIPLRVRPHHVHTTTTARTLATATVTAPPIATVATTAVAVTAFTLADMPAPCPVSHIMEPLLTREVLCSSSLFLLPACFASSLFVLLFYPCAGPSLHAQGERNDANAWHLLAWHSVQDQLSQLTPGVS